MRIDSGLPVRNNQEIERTQKKAAASIADKSTSSGVVSQLSGDVVRLNSLAAQANDVPEIRQDKVDSLRQAIHSGTYKVSDEALADAILRDALRR